MHAMNNSAASSFDNNFGFVPGKSFEDRKQRRNFGSTDDEGNRNRGKLGIKRAARQQAQYDEAEAALRDARMGCLSVDDDQY